MRSFALLISIVVIFSCSSCNRSGEGKIPADLVNIPKSATDKVNDQTVPKIVFETTTHDFGRVVQGERVTYGYKFKNEGTKDLLIVKVNATCGCTVIDFPDKPIPPGEGGVLHVTFNSTAKKGYQNKKVTVMANTQPSNTILWVKANVVME